MTFQERNRFGANIWSTNKRNFQPGSYAFYLRGNYNNFGCIFLYYAALNYFVNAYVVVGELSELNFCG